MFSKYERRTDTRTYGDRKKLYEGGWEVVRAEMLAVMKSMTRKKKKRRRRRKRKRRRNKKSLTLCDAINPMNSWLIKTRLCIQWRRLDRLSSLHTGQMSSSIHFIHSALLGRCFHIYIYQ